MWVTASEDDTVRIKKLITLLDKETPRGKGKIRVYYLEYATAEELAKVLQELPRVRVLPLKAKQPPRLSRKKSKSRRIKRRTASLLWRIQTIIW